MRVAQCSMSVGGVVTKILLFNDLTSILRSVSLTVSSMVFLNSIPRYLMLSGVANPLCCSSCSRAGDEFRHSANDL